MPFRRDELAKKIADRLNVVASQLKTRTRASFTDANHSLEFIMARFLNALFGWNLTDLNAEQQNFPAADIGDRGLRIAIQVTNEDSSAKVTGTREKALSHGLGKDFDRLIIFFLLPQKPGMPKNFVQPSGGPEIECWDLADLLKQMNNLSEIAPLAAAVKILDDELGSADARPVITPLHQLPPNPRGQGFVGRAADLAKLRVMNPSSGAHITGLRGMGGIGKTALALVLAYEWATCFPDAQLFLDGRGTQADPPSARKLMEQVVLAFHPTAKLPDDDTAIATIYRDVLGGKKMLILLDNARDVAQAKPLIPPAGCALIVTSRHTFMLGTVSPHDVGRLLDAEAVALVRKFHASITEADAGTLVKLCSGLPLALRLAGAHLAMDAVERGGTPNVAAYLQSLGGGRIVTLDSSASDVDEVTISETLRLSEAQLPEAEREAWRKLGIFTASFVAYDAKAIAGADAAMLSRFVRRSLLEREGVERFKVHDLAADYARGQLGLDALGELHLAHAKHYTSVARLADGLYKIKGKAALGLALFDSERTQIETAYAWLSSRGDENAARQLLSLMDVVAYTGDRRFHPRQRLAWAESQLRAALMVKDRKDEGSALNNLGIAHKVLGDAPKAAELHEQALAIAREIGDRCGEGVSLGNLGVAYNGMGEPHKAIEYFEQHLVIARESDDRHGEASALGNLGIAHRQLGDASKAIEYYKQDLAIRREIGDLHGEAIVLFCLGNVHRSLGEVPIVIEFFDQNLIIVRELCDQRAEGRALWNSARAHDLLGNRSEAIARGEAALAIFEAIEDPDAAMIRGELAELRREGNHTSGLLRVYLSPSSLQ